MADIFQLDKKDLKKLIKFAKRAPKQFNKATAFMLNDMAFGTKQQAAVVIKRTMTVRSESFVKSSLIFERAKPSQDIGRQMSLAGSRKRARFSGWEEQALGTRTKRDREISIAARTGKNWNKKVRGKARLKSGNKFKKPSDFRGKDKHTRAVAMLQKLGRDKEKNPFMIYGHRRIKSGLYHYRGRRLEMLQNFDPRQPQPRKNNWMKKASTEYIRTRNTRKKWGEAINFALKFPK